ncbi:MAG: polysaccharide deacetylase family protein [Candidatus Hodarchaeota archaeon]
MSPSIIEKMGFEKDDKVVIFHIDDMGITHAANQAAFECLEFGVASSGSVITTAPWFMEVAYKCQQNKKFDIGVHVTLTSEYSTCRWRPLSTVDPKTGLFDKEGYFWRTLVEAAEHVDPDAAIKEMRAQVKMALNNGIDLTHIDCHMGTVVHPNFIWGYLSVAQEFNLPAYLPRPTPELIKDRNLGEYTDLIFELTKQLEEEDFPFVDHWVAYGHTLSESEDKTGFYIELIDSLKPGLSHLLFHPSKMDPELKALDHLLAEGITCLPLARHQDYEAFTDPRLKKHVEASGVKVIGYREIRDFIRKNS